MPVDVLTPDRLGIVALFLGVLIAVLLGLRGLRLRGPIAPPAHAPLQLLASIPLGVQGRALLLEAAGTQMLVVLPRRGAPVVQPVAQTVAPATLPSAVPSAAPTPMPTPVQGAHA